MKRQLPLIATLACAAAMLLLSVGCDVPWPPATTQPDGPVATTQPQEATATTAPATQETPSIGRPIVLAQTPTPAPTTAPAGPSAAAPAAPAVQGTEEVMIRVGVPPGEKVDYTMPGMGAAPAGGGLLPQDQNRAAMQAAILVAVYNVTKEMSPRNQKDTIEDGYIDSDQFRFAEGLQVRGQTRIQRGVVKQFDITMSVPAGPGANAPAFQVHLRDFALDGPVLSNEQLDRLFRATGDHLAVMKVEGPDARGYYTAEVGLIRGASGPYQPPR